MSAVADAQTRAQAQGLVDGSSGWVSSRRMVHDEQDRLVVFTEAGGPGPEVRTGEEFHDVQVRVRGQPHDGDGAEAKLRAIRDDLHGKVELTIDGTPYVEIRAVGEALLMGYDDNDRPEMAQTFRFER